MELVVRLVAGILLTAANAFFVVTEFALTRLAELDREEVEGDRRLLRAWEMTKELELYLTGCQLGITTSSILLGVVAEPAVTSIIRPGAEALGVGGRWLELLSITLAVVVINLVHKIWGEQAPTYLGVERPRAVGRLTAPAHEWWCRITKPLILAGDGMAKATLGLFGVEIRRSWHEEHGEAEAPEEPRSYRAVHREIRETLGRGPLAADRQREVLRALEIERLPISEIMTPREEIRALSTELSMEENFARLAEHRLVRFPVFGESPDDVRGVVYVPALFGHLEDLRSGRTGLEDVTVESFFLDADVPVSEAIDRFQEARQELALVVDEGRVVGLLTATDAFEAIAGELEDPYDREEG